MDATEERFAFAREHEHELNPRQRHVLALIERGRTNQEIADELGITLAGAKWHVSEILSKLGLASREEAAEYWHARNGRLARRLTRPIRGLAGLVPLKWAAGGAGALCVALAVFAILSAARDDGEFKGAYIETRLTVHERRIPDEFGRPVPEPGYVTRVWYGPEFAGSFERGVSVGTISEDLITAGYDGERFWFHQAAENSLSWSDVDEPRPSFRAEPPAPYPGPVDASDLEDFVRKTRERAPEMLVEVQGTRTILGRDTTGVRYGPISRFGLIDDPPTGAEGQPNGFITAWIDLERMVVMRIDYDYPDQFTTLEVVDIEWDRAQPPERLDSGPPVGATEGGGTFFSALYAGISPTRPAPASPPPPFLDFTADEAWSLDAYFELTSLGDPLSIASVYVKPVTTNRLFIEQIQRESLPDSLTTGSPRQVGPYQVWLHQKTDGPYAALHQNGLAISVQGTGGTTEEEVLAAVASLQVVE